MRDFLVVGLLFAFASGLSGCTPYIPVKDDFGTSALVALCNIPPEFAEFNNYETTVSHLLADQICATPYQVLDEKALGGLPGGIVQLRARCRAHVPFFGP
jgi:hypothetical protein